MGKALLKVLSTLQKKLIISIPVAMILGLAFGAVLNASFLKNLIIPLTFLMVYPMMVTLNIREIFKRGDMKLQLTAQAVNFLVIPFVGFGIGMLFFRDSPFVILGLLLATLLPTSGMTISWTGFAKGNMPAAVKMTVIGLVMGALLTPLYIKLLMGTAVDVSFARVSTQILFIVFLPLIAGSITQWLIIKKAGKERFHNDIKKKFPMVSTVGVLLIIFVSMALKAKSILANPVILLYYLLPLVLLYVVSFLLATVIGRLLFKRQDAIALVYGTAVRNLSVALAIAVSAFGDRGSDAALIIALAYIIQVQSAAWYVKLTDKIFKKAEANEQTVEAA